MNLQQLNPWNWFKHENFASPATIPVKRSEITNSPSWSSSHSILQLQNEIDQLFYDAFRGTGFPSKYSRHSANDTLNTLNFQAKVNIGSDDKNYHISMEVPGLTENDISLDVIQNTLTIRGEKKEEKESKERHYYRVEHAYGSFQRVLALPNDATQNDITATIKNGMLDIVVPRKSSPTAETRHIPINS